MKKAPFIIGLLLFAMVTIIELFLFQPFDTTSHREVLGTSNTIATNEPSTQPFCQHVPVLFYHHIEPLYEAKKKEHAQFTVDTLEFERQLIYLQKNGYKTVTAQKLINSLLTKDPLPAKSVVITIDDGFEDIYPYAFPLIKKYNFVASLMLPTGLVGTKNYLTWDQVKEMNASGVFSIYNHSVTHANFTYISKEQMQKEIIQAKEDLQNKLGITSTTFTYPFGDINDTAIALLKENGYKGAFSTIQGQNQCDTDIMRLSRTRIGNQPLSAYGL
jgi:peptidoglycan/xylan/chitin deacetylase (PgdA/CDA1 family)